MRKTNVAIYAAAALGLCLMSPNGASAFPAADGAGKAYTQTVTGKNAVVPVRWVGHRGWGGRGYGFGRGIGWRGAGWRGGYGFGRGFGWRGAGLRGGYYGGYGGYGLGLGWGWPL